MSGEVRLHRSVSLDQMAEFDPNTGLWHSDGTFEVVRFHEVLPTDGKENVTHIALPLARHAALMRVVEAAVKWGQHNAGWVVGDVESILPSKQLMGAVDAYLATAPSRQGEAPRE